MSEAVITLHADGLGYPIEFRCAAIDVVQPVMMGDHYAYTNVQVGARVYAVRERRETIAVMRAYAEAEAHNARG